ncbi:MAG: hypothetical protein IJ637_04995 [Prevotella sp.]|nr:hypothetical protein [Prevotella sp.]
MNSQTAHIFVWLSRIHHCRGFGIQSPTDYAFVRYVINEHWPYYAYEQLTDDDWLTQKLGRLYFRLANWRQPKVMLADRWQRYWQAGCRTMTIAHTIGTVELACIDIDDQQAWQSVLQAVDDRSVVVVEGINRNPRRWQQLKSHCRVTISFDLYYCAILMFDSKRQPQHYIINF